MPGLSLGLGLNLSSPSKAGGAQTTQLRRENNGTVTVLSVAPAPTFTLTRQPNGSVTVGA